MSQMMITLLRMAITKPWKTKSSRKNTNSSSSLGTCKS